ncbi:MAG: hypothetical protein KKD07_05765 [Candidatus Omnitrophica bacterium]|nr:hypothetical protein [Candidatus Omnitrophota bacterium]MBU1996903.1 hypothetical protein [Candidatus Omnitrophota bacterium]MBU4333929.1 hypothetical protein [Candidatus Omnitrophota bacterium]
MRKILVLLVICLVFVGCTTTQKGAAIGGLGAAAVGGIIGHQSGKGAEGAAIGAAAGALGGYVVGEKMKQKFCPVCGRHFDDSVVYCPYDGDELKLRVK